MIMMVDTPETQKGQGFGVVCWAPQETQTVRAGFHPTNCFRQTLDTRVHLGCLNLILLHLHANHSQSVCGEVCGDEMSYHVSA